MPISAFSWKSAAWIMIRPRILPFFSAENCRKSSLPSPFWAGAEPAGNGLISRASFSWQAKPGGRALEVFTYHPLEGIRCYAAYLYPEGMEDAIYQEGRALIDSITFLDLEALYREFL